MSRVLKFRIWDKANKEYMILGATGLDARNGDVIDYYNEGNRLGGPEEYDVEQYTGLKDKNGKEIYEGDIVEIGKYGKFQIIWNEWACKFDFDKIGKREREEPLLSQDWEEKAEVIGNIHENKELWGESV